MSERDILNYFINAGYSKPAAAAIIGTLMSESSLNPNAVNKHSGAYGYAQWLGSRKKELFKRYGEKPTAENQLEYILWELQNTHKKANKVLTNSQDIHQLVDAMFGNYEFSAGKEGAIRAMNNSGQNGEASLADKLKYAVSTYNKYYGNISPYKAVDYNNPEPNVYFDNAVKKPILTGRVVQNPNGKYSVVDTSTPSAQAYENADRAARMASTQVLSAPVAQVQPKTVEGPTLQDTTVYGRSRAPRLTVPSLMDTQRQYLNYQMLKNAGMIEENDDDDFLKYVAVNNLMIPRFEGGKDAKTIPEVVITPDRELRQRVNNAYPDKTIRSAVLNEVEQYKRAMEAGNRYYDVGSEINVDPDGRGYTGANTEVENLLDMHNRYVNSVEYDPDNEVYTETYPTLINPQNVKADIYVGNKYPGQDYLAELPHAIQYGEGLNKYGEYTRHLKYPVNADDYAYDDPNNIEYQAHNPIAREMYYQLRKPHSTFRTKNVYRRSVKRIKSSQR